MSREPSPTPIPQNGGAAGPSEASPGPPMSRSNRPSRACTLRAAARMQAAAQAQAAAASELRRAKSSAAARRRRNQRRENGGGDGDYGRDEDDGDGDADGEADEDGAGSSPQQCGAVGKIVTSLVAPPPPSQLPRWSLRSMWELASVLNFLHVFRPLLNISAEFSAEEFETALITPNDTLSDIHIPLLKAIPPITRMALTRDTWVTVLCRKLRDWWHWVADGDLPIVASHGAEVETYKTLDPGVRVIILKALCDIRVEQEDIRNYIDNSLKHGAHISSFRKERVGGDSHGISYWYEDDSLVGHRLHREIRKFELKRAKLKGSNVPLTATYEWETVATNFDEFEDVSEKLFSSKNRTEASLGKKLKNDMLPEIEKIHKRKERMLKKQHRQALLLDNFYGGVDGLAPGRSLRDRKPVTYTFDDYDRSINEAIKITKRKQPSPEPFYKRDGIVKPEASINGKWSGPSYSEHVGFSALSPKSPDYDDEDEDNGSDPLDRSSNRRRQRPQRYSEKDFVEAISDNDPDFDSDDDIVGEAIYDEEYLRKRKQRRKLSSSSEGDEEYHWDDDNADEEEEEEEEESLSISEDSDEPRKFKKLPGRTRRETKLRSVGDLQSGLRRSKRSTRNRINYRQYDISESEGESTKPGKLRCASDELSDATENDNDNDNDNENGVGDFSMGSPVSDGNDDDREMDIDQPVEGYPETVEKEEPNPPPEKSNSPVQDENEGVRQRRFLDLNEIATGDLNEIAPGDLNETAPGSSFNNGPNTVIKDDDTDDF